MYIINSVGTAYHQNEVLYIIKSTKYTPEGVMKYKGDNVALDDIHADT